MSDGEGGGRIVNLPAQSAMGFIATMLLFSTVAAFLGGITIALLLLVVIGYKKAGWLGATLGATILLAAYVIGGCSLKNLYVFGAAVLLIFIMYLPILIIGDATGRKK